MQDTWHIISGKYPPLTGGVSDYTVALSRALADRGCSVHLWVRGFETEPERITPNLTVHRCVGDFDGASLKNLGSQLANFSGPRKILVQYVPHAYGFKAMNLGFANWVRSRGRDHGDDVRIMFHEVAYPWVGWPIHHNLLALVNRLMARRIIQSASMLYVSTTAWNRYLVKLGAAESKIQLLPIPSNVPRANSADALKLRETILDANSREKLVGHFGTYGRWVGKPLIPIVIESLRTSQDIRMLLIGDGSVEFRTKLLSRFPNWAKRVIATGRRDLGEIAVYISCCDVMVQPYGDGVNARRSSFMACLINGKAVLTNLGVNSEGRWKTNKSMIVEGQSPVDFARKLRHLLENEQECVDLGIWGENDYSKSFSMEKAVEILLEPAMRRIT